MTELVEKYRPKKLSDVVGQSEVVDVLEEKLLANKLPQAIMFIGPRGCGKSSTAHIIAAQLLGCEYEDLRHNINFKSINAASTRGIDSVRELEKEMGYLPLGAKCRVFLWEEVHDLSRQKNGSAQSALLDIVEHPPKHVYFLATTTNPSDLLPTFRDRFTQFVVRPLQRKEAVQFVENILLKEKKDGHEFADFGEDVIDSIVDASEGSPRLLTKNIDKVIGLESDEERIDLINRADVEKQSKELCRMLFTRTSWKDVAATLKGLEGEEAESIRRGVLGHARKILLGGGTLAPKAYDVIYAFEGNVFDSGHAGLARACWGVINA